MSRCKSCNAEIEWMKTEKGAFIPLDIGLVLGGNIEIRDRIAVYVNGSSDVSRRISHFVSCPNADEHRSKP